MRIWCLPLIVWSVLCLPSVVHAAPITHVARPLGVFCSADGCTGVLPHATDNASNCVSGITQLGETDLRDGTGYLEGKVYLFASNLCHTMWATVYASSTYMTSFCANSYRDANTIWGNIDSDDPHKEYTCKNFPNYALNSWNDAPMVGYDDDFMNLQGATESDCAHGWAHWEDRYTVWRDTNTAENCIA